MSPFHIFNPDSITNARVKQLSILSNNLPPFDLHPSLIEMGDENGILSERRQDRSATYRPIALDYKPSYLLVYYDGQLVEVTDLIADEIVFRNITAQCWELG
jgi:hypothetical protein